MKTELNDYTLWWDGTVEVLPSKIEEMIISGVDIDHLAVSEDSTEVQRFNRMSSVKIKTKTALNSSALEVNWDIPDPYKSMDVDAYVLDVLIPRVTQDGYYTERLERIAKELEYYSLHNYYDLLRTLIYTVDNLKKTRNVWGVGRGSSCASYLLYLIGLHSVDPVKYRIPLEEFFK